LTPDNYGDVVSRFILSARESVLFENQSFSLSEDEDNLPEHFRELAEALLKQQQRGLDVRIIFRSGFGKERDTLRKLVEFGFKPTSVRHFDKVHTKGIVVDGKAVLLGSQNWTGAGTGPNRDASLLIQHPKAGKYFTELFEYDWKQMAKTRVRDDLESMPPIRVLRDRLEAGVPKGYHVLTFTEAMDL
jgi:phosphatidylserine/phosphatidylglycerophosphate/cardiolipin synthase-like enzyme